jgi:hypothetical protein
MATNYSNLQAVLYDKQSVKGSTFTHTCMKGGSYNLPPCDLDQFHKLYIKDLLNNKDLHITEKHREVSPVLIDTLILTLGLKNNKMNENIQMK